MVVWDHHHRSEHGGGCFLQRRMFVAAGLSAFATYAMVQEAAAAASGFDSRLSAARWIQRQDELARALHAGTVSHVAWHDEVDRLAGQVEIDQLLAEIGRGQSTAHTPFMRDPVSAISGSSMRMANPANRRMRLGGERRADGTILAPIVSFKAAMERYTAHV
jgi:hypothetical protein